MARYSRIIVLLAALGPGLVAAAAGNDAGGIATYASAGAVYGYRLLWLLFLITFTLAVAFEMAARMAVVTGKGLSDLIREEFRVRWTFFAVGVLLIANQAVVLTEFAGVAAGMEMFGISRYLSVPLVMAGVWLMVVRGSYPRVEKLLLALSAVFLSYVVSAFLVPVDWRQALSSMLIPSRRWLSADLRFLEMAIALVGTTIAPWMLFYLQSSTVEKGAPREAYRFVRLDVLVGAVSANLIALFIIVTTAATLYPHPPFQTASQVAVSLQPLAGSYAAALFAVGLFGASVLAAGVVPVSTAYAVCEALGWERGIGRKFSEAPVFYGIFTSLMLVGGGLVLLPGLPLIRAMILAQTVNGALVPVILVFMLLLVNRPHVMGRDTNSPRYNAVVWLTVLGVAGMVLLLLALQVRNWIW